MEEVAEPTGGTDALLEFFVLLLGLYLLVLVLVLVLWLPLEQGHWTLVKVIG